MGEIKERESEHGRREDDGAGWMRLRMKIDSGAKYWTHLSLWFQTVVPDMPEASQPSTPMLKEPITYGIN